MSTKPGALKRRGVQALTVAAVVAGGLAVASPAYAAPPAITGVVVAGTTSKVVGPGTTILITGTGFAGMTDNAAAAPCSIAPVAWPDASSGCSQVRFLGKDATATTGYTLATRYTVVSDTQIYAVVPTIPVGDGASLGNPLAGTGSVKVQVVNTMATGIASGVSVSTASEVFYRGPITAAISATGINMNPVGGGVLTVPVTGVAALTSTTFPLEKITGYFVNGVTANSPQVAPATVSFKDATNVNVTVPPGSPSGNLISLVLVHDGIVGTADSDSLKYPAVITGVQSCSASLSTWIATPTTTFPTCTGTANVSGATGDVKVTGKGFTGTASADWNFDGADGTVVPTCAIISDTTAYCHLAITTPPTNGVAAVTFTPKAQNGVAAATFVPTGGSVLIFTSLV
ncbi:hypothetical protein GCM10010172_10160 [Paractinoplanes ferrugineus]|uniref:IPT/TIG domain-containing protein n=1 Tax=Paractinoplanes ferrugineus TaxID=113564 RepID=A0A919IV89_9ACTN|nr:IPT/TIG domain-containing protein [Actinoplanes ferrugineus]GIE09580.1 hypothetical protein Afe05nite_14200 [Actinoplanes ferrugineus]